MLAEKLLLNLLITLSPVLLYSVLLDNNKKLSPYLTGLLQSTSVILCVIFSYYNYAFHWDLRYVPLILAILYGGRLAGGIVLGTLIIIRIMLGGHTVYFGLINTLSISLIPFIIRNKFWSLTPNKRVMVSFSIGLWTIFMCYFSLLTFRFMHGRPIKFEYLPDLLLIAIIETAALAIAAKLNEGIIERNKMRQEILRAEKLNTLGELAASIAHEIRNPLTVVKGFLQLMQKEEKDKKYEYLSLVLNELGRAEGIINDYLNFAKPQFEKLEEFTINDVLAEVIMLLAPLSARQGVQLISTFDENEFILYTDRNQLKQALVNLIKNAIEATSEGGQVTVVSKVDDHHVTVLITDTGKGMTPEQLSRIGTLFYTTKEKGTGLGTSVSLRIIETMNGKVTYNSSPGLGTEVMLLLPDRS